MASLAKLNNILFIIPPKFMSHFVIIL